MESTWSLYLTNQVHPPPPSFCYQICSPATADAESDSSPDEKRRGLGVSLQTPPNKCRYVTETTTGNLTTLGRGSIEKQAIRLTTAGDQSLHDVSSPLENRAFALCFGISKLQFDSWHKQEKR